MKSPKDMAIIEIELTNGCIHKCSNCTRFCGHHEKNFYMDFETFKKAVDSLEGFGGTISLMGGEPTLHPEFDKFAEYLGSKVHGVSESLAGDFIYPQKEFMEYRGLRNICNMSLNKRSDGKARCTVNSSGMFSALPRNFLKYYESIQDNIAFQGLNDHSKPMYHQPILISRKELGIGDDEWVEIRDNCWVNQKWSASITPKGAFFCEIAGALDMLFDGPGGWPIEKDWWKREEKDFGEQLNWCEICGLALKTFSRNANDEIDDISEEIYNKLGRKTKKSVNVVRIENGKVVKDTVAISEYHGDHYSESYNDRYTKELSPLYPKEFKIVDFDKKNGFGLGLLLSRSLVDPEVSNYIVIKSGKRDFSKNDMDEWRQYVINPGTLHISKDSDDDWIVLINKYAKALRRLSDDELINITSISDLIRCWDTAKIVDFDEALKHKNSIPKIDNSFKYVIYGTGNNGELVIREFVRQGIEIIAVIDSNPDKEGELIEGFKINTPEYLASNANEYDFIFIASTDYYEEIKEQIIMLGICKDKIYNLEKFW